MIISQDWNRHSINKIEVLVCCKNGMIVSAHNNVSIHSQRLMPYKRKVIFIFKYFLKFNTDFSQDWKRRSLNKIEDLVCCKNGMIV